MEEYIMDSSSIAIPDICIHICGESKGDSLMAWIWLDIECVVRLIIATDSNLMDDMVLAHVLMISKSTRMAHDLIEGINQDEFMRGSSEDFLQNIVNMLSTVFLGTNYLNDGENQVKIKQEEARDRMTKLQICDLCYLDQFTYDYEEALLNVPNTEWIGYIEGYLRKIPYIGKESLEEYQALPHISKLSLIVAKNIVSKKLTKICTDRQLLKKTKKINLCCPEFQGPETMYGCQTVPQIKKWKKKIKKKYRFKKPKKKKYYSHPKRYKKYFGHKTKRKRFFKKKNYRDLKGLNDEPKELSQTDKQKFCPQKKKTCKCWICQEIGHMSYECPNTKPSKAHAKVFEEMFLEEALEQYNLAPLETLDDVTSDEELYYLESETDSETDDYSETSSDISDQE
ncbi:hypothetical protein POTOM_019729 [Populus tomentosa]|uniref:CCHC-type domain-containing protein n=1 Tax=Populus tomentosa TaxID=118781 RepID=A0A8X8A1P9_POPTO|nr:hypothetical protein POTOM_019729 [Populus tomentosa]